MGEVMKVRYDAEADILYISIKDDDIEDMDELGEDIFVEYNRNGENCWHRNLAGSQVPDSGNSEIY